jgi:hypothetical protein
LVATTTTPVSGYATPLAQAGRLSHQSDLDRRGARQPGQVLADGGQRRGRALGDGGRERLHAALGADDDRAALDPLGQGDLGRAVDAAGTRW